MRFLNKTVIVTGGASGQGAEECRLLAAEGAHVIIADVTEEVGLEFAEQLSKEGSAEFYRLDVSKEENWKSLRDHITSQGRQVAGLVNNAGIGSPGRLGNLEVSAWERSYAVNATGAMLGMQTIAPIMPPGSAIVNIGSIASHIAHHNVGYSAAKWALRGLTRTASVELAKSGIRVNLVHPGYIDTPINARMDPRFKEVQLSLTPLNRAGTVTEIARSVAFLLSDDASFITGVELPVDGGFLAHGGQMAVFNALD